MIYFFGWIIGSGVLLALWSLIFDLDRGEDAYDYYIYLAKAQRAFVAGCMLGAMAYTFQPFMNVFTGLILLSALLLIVARLGKIIKGTH